MVYGYNQITGIVYGEFLQVDVDLDLYFECSDWSPFAFYILHSVILNNYMKNHLRNSECLLCNHHAQCDTKYKDFF